MLILVLGKGKTGSLVAEVARERGHGVRALDIDENTHASALTAPNLAGVDVVVDFTAPEAAVENMRAVLAIGGHIVVGTTGWYAKLDEMKALAAQRGGGLLYGTNFSIGVQKFSSNDSGAAQKLEGYKFSIARRTTLQSSMRPRGTALSTLKEIVPWRRGRESTFFVESHRVGDARYGRAPCACSERLRHAGTEARCTFATRVCAGRSARRGVAQRQAGRVGVPRDFRSTLNGSAPIFHIECRP